MIQSIEGTYDVSMRGPWTVDELAIVNSALQAAADFSGGVDNLNDLFHDALTADGSSQDRLTFQRISGYGASNDRLHPYAPPITQTNGYYHAAWCAPGNGDTGCGSQSPIHHEGAIIISDDIFESDYQFTTVGPNRPLQLIGGNYALAVEVTILHEMGHVVADAQPGIAAAAQSYTSGAAEEWAATSFALYIATGGTWSDQPERAAYASTNQYYWRHPHLPRNTRPDN